MAPQECVNGTCVGPTCTPACVAPEECVNGACSCPASQACGEICCSTAPECEEDYCTCDGLDLCSCPSGDFLCEADVITQCCLDSDTCDPANACVTDTCSAGNEVCTPEWAFCNDAFCGCFLKVEDGTSVCGDLEGFEGCPEASECDGDADCTGDEVCVNVSCCADPPANVGLCVPPCGVGLNAATRDGRAAARRKRALMRQRG